MEDIEHFFYANIVSENEEEYEEKSEQKHAPKCPAPLFKPISYDSNLQTTNVREENINYLAPPGTQLPAQENFDVILTE